ncbi:MAG TPA: hypothetical protein VJ647_00235, partial [Chitinophagaceae bacterium]|nr:hypothetical protein [Chitinophagaceae bacterium]
ELFSEAGDYIETKTELWKLKVADKASEIVSSVTSGIVITIACLFFFALLNIGIALWIGDAMGNNYSGFFVLAGFYALVALLVYLCRDRWLKAPVSNAIIRNLFK